MKIHELNRRTEEVLSDVYKKLREDAKEKEEITQRLWRGDKVEISDIGKKQLEESEKAKVPKDGLKITKKGSIYRATFKGNSLSKALEDGFIMVNGEKVLLSEDVKKGLQNMKDIAEKKNEYSNLMSNIEHDIKQMERNAETTRQAAREMDLLNKIKLKAVRGQRLSPKERKFLIERDPKGYQMIMQLQMMIRRDNKKTKSLINKDTEREMADSQRKVEGIDEAIANIQTSHFDVSVDISFSGGEGSISNIGLEETIF